MIRRLDFSRDPAAVDEDEADMPVPTLAILQGEIWSSSMLNRPGTLHLSCL